MKQGSSRPSAQAHRRRRARVCRGGDVRRALRARLRLDGMELGELRRAPHDARHVSAEGAGRDLGRFGRCVDRIVIRVPGGQGAQGRGRLCLVRALAVLERRRSERVEHARRSRAARRPSSARAARVSPQALAIQGHRHLARGRIARHRQQRCRGEGTVRAGAHDARGRRHEGRTNAGQRGESGHPLSASGVRAFSLHAVRRRARHRRGPHRRLQSGRRAYGPEHASRRSRARRSASPRPRLMRAHHGWCSSPIAARPKPAFRT